MKRAIVLTFAGALFMAGFTACSDDGSSVRDGSSASGSATGSGTGSGTAGGTAVAVCDPYGNAADADTTVGAVLNEWEITLERTEIPAGMVHFAIENQGAMVHEFLIVRADSVDDLPLADDGSLDEEALPEGAFIGEVGGFPAGETCDGTFELAAGSYVAVCNLVEEHDGETMVHLAEGMAIPFTVTA